MNWLAPDSKFMRAWGNLVDGVLINLLMLVTSLPIITIGAAITAGHDACRRSEEGEGRGVVANYCKAFKVNFVQSTMLWLPFLAALIGLVYAWVVLQITPLLIPKFALSILWIIGFEWVFALQARFENTVVGTLKNAFIFGISHIVATIALVAVDAVFVALVIGCWFYMPSGLFFLVVLGYGTMLMLHIPVTERVFRPYLAVPSSL
ncbi:YesL family protein [Bifidobacterium scaligerum]|uniref:Beta-carotene 15,15'-monooxygenase n=1 Tax=Bifidobacterium scaligerum TaxID=2052656 RepID=A0A2M9HP94_9BIFI|nr:YesL family protein [Bifidobacterium scaligerum]PJM78642.1 beta-carotene 15,15'-monooxygenase [Bifidobacterium scaligerum]